MGSKQKNIKISFTEVGKISDLNEMDKQLVDLALRATDRAYAPYSGFKVGTAVLMEGGVIISGSNQENAAYPSGLCAERVALFAASSDYPDRVMEKVVIVSKDKNGQIRAVTPCGSCRQVLYEYEIKQREPIQVLIFGEDEILLEFKDAQSLLPFGFSKDQMV
jgi:cytidine deaminase